MTRIDDIRETQEWIAELERRRADPVAMGAGLVLGEPQCPRGCARCTLACCMTTIVLEGAREMLVDMTSASPSAAVH